MNNDDNDNQLRHEYGVWVHGMAREGIQTGVGLRQKN